MQLASKPLGAACAPKRSARPATRIIAVPSRRHLFVPTYAQSGAGGPAPGEGARRVTARAAAAPPAPAGATKPTPHWQQALAELEAKPASGKVLVVQTAPAVRVAISETLGLPPGAVTQGQLVTGLRKLGFDYVFDTLFGADLTIMEEGTELLRRLEAKAAERAGAPPPAAHGHAAGPILPMFTSCCPGWVAMVEKSNPELIPFLSTCKSPQMMLAAVIKSFFAKVAGVKPSHIVSCSIMPCVRKQGEADREWFGEEEGAGEGDACNMVVRDLDHVITTAELGKIFQEQGINLAELPESEYDNPLGAGSGGGVLFGTTGGVMEAALRTVYELVSGQPMGRVLFQEVRGLEGTKEATLTIPVSEGSAFKALEPTPGAGVTLRIAVANGLGHAKKLIKGIADGSLNYDFVEVMACPGGCIGGGGQPRSTDKTILQQRQAAMYDLDERSTVRRSHENPQIQELYSSFFGEPNGELAHKKLHTHYVAGGTEADK